MSRETVNARVDAMKAGMVEALSHELQDLVLELHETAPRGGPNLNYYNEFRSAEGEPPAIEHGDLREAILDGREFNPGTASAKVIVNTLWLEIGTSTGLKPRPMGQIALETLRVRHGGES